MFAAGRPGECSGAAGITCPSPLAAAATVFVLWSWRCGAMTPLTGGEYGWSVERMVLTRVNIAAGRGGGQCGRSTPTALCCGGWPFFNRQMVVKCLENVYFVRCCWVGSSVFMLMKRVTAIIFKFRSLNDNQCRKKQINKLCTPTLRKWCVSVCCLGPFPFAGVSRTWRHVSSLVSNWSVDCPAEHACRRDGIPTQAAGPSPQLRRVDGSHGERPRPADTCPVSTSSAVSAPAPQTHTDAAFDAPLVWSHFKYVDRLRSLQPAATRVGTCTYVCRNALVTRIK